YAYSHDPTSFFFDPSKGYQWVYSSKREKQADAFIDSANRAGGQPSSQSSPSICLGVATIARTKEQYIRRTIGSLLQGLTDDQRGSIHLAVFFAQTDPSQHPIYNEPWLKNLANEILQYDVSNETMARLHALEENHHFWNKSMFDYQDLLKNCVDTGSDWIMIVEDDVLAKEGWYIQATDALRNIQMRMKRHEWLYLRLFYTEKLLDGTARNGLSILGGLYSPLWSQPRPWLSAEAILVAYASTCPTYPSSLMEQIGCWPQGLIFPRLIVPRAMNTVKHATDQRYYADMTLERWANSEGLPRFALVPPLLQHVGSKSSKGSEFDQGANSIWNFAFENYA
ncbi:MAG: hypothetical protein L6R42_009556, partial [Xanthoria sp. 1 TBL-2021]